MVPRQLGRLLIDGLAQAPAFERRRSRDIGADQGDGRCGCFDRAAVGGDLGVVLHEGPWFRAQAVLGERVWLVADLDPLEP